VPTVNLRKLRHLFLASCLIGPGTNANADWPQFRGGERDGAAETEVAIDPTLNDGDPKIVWRAPVGSGFAGPAISRGTVVLPHREGDELVVQSWDLESGEPRWSQRWPTDYVDGFGFDNGPRAVPAVAGDKIIVFGAEGRLLCLDFTTGGELWSRQIRDELGADKGFFGRASSPLIHDGLVHLVTGGSEGCVSAFNLETGDTHWSASQGEAGYASPTLIRIPDSDEFALATVTRDRFLILNPKTGRILADEPFRSSMGASVNGASPVLCGPDQVFLSACYGVGAKTYRLEKSADKLTLDTVWAGDEKLDAHYATPVFFQGLVYGYHGRQESGQQLRCIVPETGELRWSAPKGAGGSLVRIGDTLLSVTDRGELVSTKAKAEAHEELARCQILRSGHRALPATDSGFFLARDGAQLICLDLRPTQ